MVSIAVTNIFLSSAATMVFSSFSLSYSLMPCRTPGISWSSIQNGLPRGLAVVGVPFSAYCTPRRCERCSCALNTDSAQRYSWIRLASDIVFVVLLLEPQRISFCSCACSLRSYVRRAPVCHSRGWSMPPLSWRRQARRSPSWLCRYDNSLKTLDA